MSAQRLEDKHEIRRRLERDREWSLYALADLDDGMFEHCHWWAGSDKDSLALVFRALDIRPIFVIGDVDRTRDLLAAMNEPAGYLNLQPHQLDAARGIYAYRERNRMYRMIVRDFQPAAADGVATLGPADVGEVQRLYATGDGGGIAFAPFQLATGMFRGIRRDGELVAVAGVHVLSRAESVAGVGNIFTHPDHRGRGHARAVTSGVVAALREAGIATIGLNVEDGNATAIRVYERVGFRTSFHYFEGVAERSSAVSHAAK